MTRAEWNKWLEEVLDHTKKTLSLKDERYGKEEDRFHNFNIAARVNGTFDPVNEAWGMATKHLVVILDILDDVKQGKPIDKTDLPRIKEVFGDMRNYLFLIEGMLIPLDPPTV